jgi:hypothetical protein
MSRLDLLQAARDVDEAQRELAERLFVLESLLEAVDEEAV